MHRPSTGSTRAVAIFGLAALCAFLIANALVQQHTANQIFDASHWVEHTMAVDNQVEVVGSMLRDAETGQRGYLLTGQQAYLDPYRAAVRDLPIAMQQLASLVSDNPDQQQNIARLRELTASKLAEMQKTVDLYVQGHADAARAVVQTNVGHNDMIAIRELLAQMQARERLLLARRQRSLDNVVLKQKAAIVLGLGVGLLALIAFAWALLRIELVRERATAAILESEEWLATTLGSIGDAVIATDAEGRVRFLNRVAQDLTHHSQEQASGRPLREVFPIFNETTRQPAENPVDKAISTGKVVGLANHTVLVRADGSEIAIDDSAAPILDRQGKISGVVLVFRDVTEQRKIENAMRVTEKLAATGKLAATVAHEINNPLEAAANLLYLLQDEAGLSPEGRKYLLLAEQQLSRVSQITKQTLAFYKDPRTPEPLVLSDVCQRILELYRPRFRNKMLEIDTDYDRNIVVLGTEGEIAQVVSNLFTNAVDASHPNGRVHFSVKRGTDHQGLINITDTGSGIAPSNLNRVFEPFFTTKEHVGTGLGLWVSKEIVEKLGGTIKVASGGENQGASFTVTLPLYRDGRAGEAQ